MFAGLIAGILGDLFVQLQVNSIRVSGPAAGLAVIVADGIGVLGFEDFLLATFLAGILQIISGFLKAGIISFLSQFGY